MRTRKTSDTERYANLPDHEAIIKKIRIRTNTFNNVPKEIKQLKPFYDALKLRLVKGVKCAIQRRGKS